MGYEGPGFYLHYKGGEYGVVGLALQEDTVIKEGEPEAYCQYCGGSEFRSICPESDRGIFSCQMVPRGPEVQFVIYQPLTAGSLLEGRDETFWARRLGDFNAAVDETGRRRFTKISRNVIDGGMTREDP